LQLATQAIQTLRKDGGGITGALAMFKDKSGGKNSEKVKELENEITKLKRQIAQITEENEMRSEVLKNNNKHLHGENVRLKELLEKKKEQQIHHHRHLPYPLRLLLLLQKPHQRQEKPQKE